MKFLYVFTFLSTATITLNICQADTISPPPQCDPNLIEEAPYQLRKVCAALSTIYQLSSAMESYIEEKAPRQLQYLRPGNGNERFDNSVKRQDLDHVFLRFGRRRR